MTISVTLPSIYPEALAAALDNISSRSRGQIEVIVVGPFDPSVAGVKWIHEARVSGCAAAHWLGATAATGDFLVPFADDHEFVDGWDEIAVENFQRREKQDGRRFCLGLRGAHSGHVGTEFGIYYPYFPMMRRHDVEAVGGWITPGYRAGFGDSDLAMRVWSCGGRCEWSDIGLIYPSRADRRKLTDATDRRPAANYTDADMALFLSRWAPIYGAGWDTSRIDGFNIDVRPEENTDLASGNTFFFNSPDFAERVRRMAS